MVIPHSLDPTEIQQNLAVRGGAGVGGAVLTVAEMAAVAQLERSRRSLVLDWGRAFPGVLLAKDSLAKL